MMDLVKSANCRLACGGNGPVKEGKASGSTGGRGERTRGKNLVTVPFFDYGGGVNLVRVGTSVLPGSTKRKGGEGKRKLGG